MQRSRVAFLGIVCALSLTATARADVYDDNPAAASRGAGDAYLFARATDGAILERHLSGGSWTDWASLGGNATSGPAAAAYGDAINVFVRGPDGAIWQNALVGGAWRGWASLGGQAASAPAALWRRGSENAFDIAYRGTDNAVWLESYVPGRGWLGWSSLGGNATSGPALSSQSDGIVNVFVRGTDGAVAQRSWTGTQWTDWGSDGGGTVGAPASISRAPGYVNIYARAPSLAVWARSWVSTWSDWALLDSAPVDSTPAAFSDAPDHEAVIARKGADLVLKSWTAAAGWGPWTDLGPIAVPAPAAPAPAPPPPPDGEVNLVAGVRCTPPGGRARVSISIRKQKGAAKPRVRRIVFFTKGKGRRVRVDRKAPFVVHILINRPAGTTGRIYARVYFRRSAHGPLHHKTVSRRYSVCR